ncbi:MAG: tail fiber domain-containing protein [Bacteroidaceae bacterium]|nr:tail fiber domain-containing protein [Bacteroidaceae bacterium]
MKKTLLIVFAALVAASVNAQLVVDESGKTAVGYDGTSAVASDFAVNSVGASDATTHVLSQKTYGLYINEACSNSRSSSTEGDRSQPTPTYQYGIYSTTIPLSSGRNYGVYGSACSSSLISDSFSYGVYGIAGNASSGKSYGVFGTLSGSNNGAAIYGTSALGEIEGNNLTGRYAGYFRGNVIVNGTVNGMTISPSDYRLKENVETLPTTTLDNIRKINVIQFNYKQREVDDAKGKTIGLYEEDSPILTHKHYGVIAQELQKIYPDLVIEGEDGYLSVNYVELVPLLIQSVQELSAKLDEAQKSNARRDDGTTDIADAGNSLKTELFQNTPNPFTENTVIPCTIAENVTTAMLYIYDLNGKQIDQHFVEGRGKTSVTIAGHSLDAGMYLYSLIADGRVIDTKRMILTK